MEAFKKKNILYLSGTSGKLEREKRLPHLLRARLGPKPLSACVQHVSADSAAEPAGTFEFAV